MKRDKACVRAVKLCALSLILLYCAPLLALEAAVYLLQRGRLNDSGYLRRRGN